MESIQARFFKEVMIAADIMGPTIEKEINYTTDELEQIMAAAAMSGEGTGVSKSLSKGKTLVVFKGTDGTGSSSSDSIQKPQKSRFRQCDYCEGWTCCRRRWCSVCRNKVYCGRGCQMEDWPVHKESCKCARKKSKEMVPGKQKIYFTTLDELRTQDSDTIMSLIREEWAEPHAGKKAFLESLPYVETEPIAAKKCKKKQKEEKAK